MTRLAYFAAFMLAAGLAAFQGPINSALATRTGLMAANVFSNVIGTAALLLAMAVMEPKALGWGHWVSSLRDLPPSLWVGGLLGSLFMVASILAVRRIGASGWVIAAFAGQVLAGLLIDSLGLFGLQPLKVTAKQLVGILLLAMGAYLTVIRS